MLQRFDGVVSQAAEWLRGLLEVPAAEMKQTSVPESIYTQTTVKMLTRLVLLTRSSCSANYCSLHASENHIKTYQTLGAVILRYCRKMLHRGRAAYLCLATSEVQIGTAEPLLTATGAGLYFRATPQSSLSVLCPLLTWSEHWCWYQCAAVTQCLHNGHNTENIMC